eukprot:Gregarina_sp_Poly_1__2789@NODE_1776_length_3359_cov_13_717801_g1122_i1_p3_GENE_NODE_1776_length_3359_cov_13_717801_g1122_i1NODE_1776_length_3359_cov_13_717801_g1122_i1_p3_ORF_typecomplete_len244_score21_19_NODE_1776_length_3359_cov_13_717801_g1122_i19740
MTLRYHKSLQVTSSRGKSFAFNTITGRPDSVSDAWQVASDLHGKNAHWWLTPITEDEGSVKILQAAAWKSRIPTEALYYNLSNAVDVDVPDGVDLVRCETFEDYMELATNLRTILHPSMPDLGLDYYNVLPKVASIPIQERKLDHYFAYDRGRFGAAYAVYRSAKHDVAGIYDLLIDAPVHTDVNVGSELLVQILYQLYLDGFKVAISRVKKAKEIMLGFLAARWIILGPSNILERLGKDSGL